jgi:hypothetical protein
MTIETQTPSDPTAVPAAPFVNKVNWKQVGTFIGLTFGLTWLLDLFLYLKGGLSNPAVTLTLQFQMLLPAFSAILLGMFFFKDSPIHIQNNHSKFPRVGRTSERPYEGRSSAPVPKVTPCPPFFEGSQGVRGFRRSGGLSPGGEVTP